VGSIPRVVRPRPSDHRHVGDQSPVGRRPRSLGAQAALTRVGREAAASRRSGSSWPAGPAVGRVCDVEASQSANDGARPRCRAGAPAGCGMGRTGIPAAHARSNRPPKRVKPTPARSSSCGCAISLARSTTSRRPTTSVRAISSSTTSGRWLPRRGIRPARSRPSNDTSRRAPARSSRASRRGRVRDA
jgi:hypothetical protein